jgi:tape measure domain-containing protein
MASHTETVTVSVSATGAVTVKNQIKDIGDSAVKSGAEVNAFSSAIAFIATGAALAALVHYSDQFQQLHNRLKLVTNSTADLASVTSKLTTIANGTYQSLGSVATVYQRVEQASGKLKLTQEQTLDFTKQLSEATALSGVSAQTASNGLTQLTLGLGSAHLQGQHLRALLNDLPYVASAMATGMGVSVSALKELGAKGKLTPEDIIKAFDKVAPNIAADFAKLNPTISQSLQVLDNQITIFAGNTQGVMSLAAKAIIFFADNLQVIATAAVPVIASLTFLAVQVIWGQLVAALTAGVAGILSMVTWFSTLAVTLVVDVIPAFAVFTAALLLNPLTWLVAAAVAAVAALAILWQSFQTGDTWWNTLVSDVNGSWQSLVDIFNQLKSVFAGGTTTLDASPGLKQAADDLANASGSEGAIAKAKKGASAQSTSNPNLTVGQVAANQASSVSAATSAATQQLNASIKSGFTDSISLLNSSQENTFNSGASTLSTSLNKSFASGAAAIGSAIGSASGSAANSNISSAGSSSSISSIGGQTGNGAYGPTFTSTITNPASNYNPANAGFTAGGTQIINTSSRTTSGINDGYTAGGIQISNFAQGGSFRVGGSGGVDSQMVQFRASPDEHVTISTPSQQKQAANGNGPVHVAAPNVTNVLDASNIPMAMDTAAGRSTLVNMIKFNREDFRAALGV